MTASAARNLIEETLFAPALLHQLQGPVQPTERMPVPLESFFEDLPTLALVERGGQIVARNALARQFCGVPGPAPLRTVLIGAQELPAEGRFRFDCMLIRADAPPLPVAITGQPSLFRGEPCRLLLLVERWEGFSASMNTERSFLEEVLDTMPEATVIAHEGRVLHVNREFARLFDYTTAECIGRELDDLVMPEGRLHESEMILHTLRTTGRSSIETVRRTGAGKHIDVFVLASRIGLGGEAVGLFVVYRDISRQKQEQARLQYTALHDNLTGLANRALFLDRVRLTLARLRRRPDRVFSIIFLDLDGFKQVNDTLGHAAGDELLLVIAGRLTRCLRPQDTVARFGGDEFALLLDESGSETEVDTVADRIQAAVRCPIPVAGTEAHVAASMGIAMASETYADAEQIMLHADFAMYEAKSAGKRRHVFFRDGA